MVSINYLRLSCCVHTDSIDKLFASLWLRLHWWYRWTIRASLAASKLIVSISYSRLSGCVHTDGKKWIIHISLSLSTLVVMINHHVSLAMSTLMVTIKFSSFRHLTMEFQALNYRILPLTDTKSGKINITKAFNNLAPNRPGCYIQNVAKSGDKKGSSPLYSRLSDCVHTDGKNKLFALWPRPRWG